ncbi:anthocyanin regulatory R-S protein [Oryza sativa Japonica Group]|nr:anthocyanin regulatory R-S protein [Oryza sativa Japonica Group]
MMASAPSAQEEPLQPGTMQFRKQLAAAVRSISWTYAIFWSISTTRPGVLTWNDGFYNGEIKTRKIENNLVTELTAEQLLLQRSEQLRELYNSLLSGESADQQRRRPVTALSPEDLGNVEWYYVVCMTYAFRPGQCVPGKSFASNGCAWLCNAQSADSKAFPRKLLAKNASIQTIVCVPFMTGVLELGTTDPVSEEPNVVNRITTAFWELQLPACSDEPISSGTPSSPSSPPTKETGDANTVVIDDLFLAHSDAILPAGGDQKEEHQLGDDLGQQQAATAMEIDDDVIYSLIRNWDNDSSSSWIELLDHAIVSPASCFVPWKRTELDKEAVAGGEAAQRLLKKVVGGGGAWMNRAAGSCSIKNHVMSERRRREKLNEMFLILKSLVPSIDKVDKASILSETIAYLKELERRVQELESGKKVSRPAKRKPCSETIIGGGGGGGGAGAVKEHHHWVLSESQEGTPSDVRVIVMDKDELHLEVQCRWKELMMTRVFDAIKSLRLDVVSVQASAPDGLLGLKIRAKYASSAAVVPAMISETLRTAVAGY